VIVPPTSNYFGHEQTSPTTSIYFASAAVAVESSRVTASSSASWSRFSPHSDFVDGLCRQCGSWSAAGHNHKKVIGRDPICAS